MTEEQAKRDFYSLVCTYAPLVRSYFSAYTVNRETADELTFRTFTTVYGEELLTLEALAVEQKLAVVMRETLDEFLKLDRQDEDIITKVRAQIVLQILEMAPPIDFAQNAQLLEDGVAILEGLDPKTMALTKSRYYLQDDLDRISQESKISAGKLSNILEGLNRQLFENDSDTPPQKKLIAEVERFLDGSIQGHDMVVFRDQLGANGAVAELLFQHMVTKGIISSLLHPDAHCHDLCLRLSTPLWLSEPKTLPDPRFKTFVGTDTRGKMSISRKRIPKTRNYTSSHSGKKSDGSALKMLLIFGIPIVIGGIVLIVWFATNRGSDNNTSSSATTPLYIETKTVDVTPAGQVPEKPVAPTKSNKTSYKAPPRATYQAEDATKLKACQITKSGSGSTGSGLIDMGSNGSWFEWDNVRAKKGNAELIFRYSLDASSRPCTLEINGKEHGSITFNKTGSWSNWSYKRVSVKLRQGNNRIRLTAQQKGGPNVDAMEVRLLR